MDIAWILIALAAIAAIAVVIINRTTGGRPDRPLAGDDDGADHGAAAGQDSRWQTDRPGGPGLEGMNPEESGDPSPGPIEDERRS